MATLKLGNITTTNDVTTIGSIMFNNSESGSDYDVVGKQVTVAAGSAKSVALNKTGKNYGTLKMDAEGNLTLIGGSALKGDITISGDADADAVKKLTRVDFGATVNFSVGSSYSALKTVNGSTGNDKFTVGSNLGEDFVLNAGAGKDTINLTATGATVDSKINAGVGDDLVIVGNGANFTNVALGAGKDTVQFAGKATVNLTDYNYNQDVIDSSSTTAELSNNGTLTLGDGSVVSGITAANNLYLARVGTKNTTVYATAAEDTAKAVVDASSITDKTVIINTESADSAMITAGKASLTAITLNSNADAGVDTVKVGNATAKASINVVNFNTDDVLSFTGLTFDKTNISLDAGNNVTLTNGKVSVNLGKNVTVASANDANKVAKFNLDGKTLYATTANNQVIDLTEEEDITKVLVAGQNDATKSSGIMTSAQLVDLRSSNFHNIDKVVLSADTAAKASVIGTKSSKIGLYIDASKATDGVAVWANNSSTSQTDAIIFGGKNDVADTLWLGSNDGHDVVTGFDFESDVLYLADATSMTADKGVIKVGKSKLTVNALAGNTEEIIQVQGAKFEGTVYAAGDFVDNAADKIINLGENAGKVNYYAVGKKAEVEISANMSDTYTFLKDINYAGASKANIAAGGSVASINAGGVTEEDAKVIVEGVANVTLGAGTNEVWVNGAASKGNVVLGNGTDKVWFGASDKTVNVTNYDGESDTIALIGNTMDFKAKKDSSGNVVITSATGSKLKLGAPSTDFVNVVDSTGAQYKVYAGDKTASATYSTNTDSKSLFVGFGSITADSTVEDATTLVANGANNRWGLNSAAMIDSSVKEINMSGSSADFTLVGSANVANTITGGTGTNYLNGGGASKDTLNGVAGAVDNFYFGKGDGEDTLVGVEADDFVQLYNVSAADIATIKADDPSNVVITMNDKSKLTINGLTDGATFVLTDGVYTYDSTAEGSKFTKL